MEEIEVPTEHLHEAIEEKAKEHETGWSMYVAHSNEALIEQIKASDQWAYYQAKGIKAEIKALVVNGASDTAAAERYRKEQDAIKEIAAEHEKTSEAHLSQHVLLARSVTLFQVAIAISAIAILTRKK